MLSLNHKKYIARLAGQLRKVTHFYLSGVDFSILDSFKDEFTLLNTAKSQIEEILEKKQDSKCDLSEEKTKEYETQLDKYKSRIDELDERYNNDLEAQSQVDLKNELEGLALMELSNDEKFLSSIFKELGIEVKEYGTVETAKLITDTLRDFFLKMK